MELNGTGRGITNMGDVWDYKMWKAQLAWDLAMRIIPPKPELQGLWTKDSYLIKTQETLVASQEVINAVFKADTGR